MEQKKTTKVSTTTRTRTHHTHSSSNMCNAVGDVFRLGILGGIVIAVSYLIFAWMVVSCTISCGTRSRRCCFVWWRCFDVTKCDRNFLICSPIVSVSHSLHLSFFMYAKSFTLHYNPIILRTQPHTQTHTRNEMKRLIHTIILITNQKTANI